MQKFILALFFLTSPWSWAELFECSYNLRRPIRLVVNTTATPSYLIYSEDGLRSPIFLQIEDVLRSPIDEIYWGDLPSPWMEGTSFRLRRLRNSPQGEMTYIGPTGVEARIAVLCH